MQKKIDQKKKKGFTLIEILLVVVSLSSFYPLPSQISVTFERERRT